MLFCRLCGCNDNKLIADGNIDKMLAIFRDLEVNFPKNYSDVTCLPCLTSLQFCYTFYLRLAQSTRVLSEKLKTKESAFRRIAPKQVIASDTAEPTIKQYNMKKRRYTCEECPYQFTSYRQLLVHHKIHENANVCQYCGTFYLDENTLNVHINDDHNDLKYNCLKCQTSFTSRSSLWKHLKKDHQTTHRQYYCSDCKQPSDVFLGRESMEKHIEQCHPLFRNRNESKGPRDLPDCDGQEDIEPDMIEEFLDDMDEEFLDDILMNGDQNSFCWDDFSLTHFDEHFNSPTPTADSQNYDRYECPQCAKRFTEQHFLNRHLAHDHNEFVLVCNTCGLAFNRFDALKEHWSSHSTGKTANIKGPPFHCTTCDRTYKTLAGLKYHLKTHSGTKPFICPYCKKTFTANINLNAHIRCVHTDVKPNLCTLCDRKFATLDHLKKHVMSVHQKEKNHLCSVCGKAFSQASHLTQHSLIHTGQKPFKCSFCKMDFFKKIDLKRHTQVDHESAAES